MPYPRDRCRSTQYKSVCEIVTVLADRRLSWSVIVFWHTESDESLIILLAYSTFNGCLAIHDYA